MAKKSTVKSSEVESWLNKVKFADQCRHDADLKYGYSRTLAEYRGDYESSMPSFIKNANLIPINEVSAYTKAFIPSVYSRNPHISFNAKGRRSIGGAKMMELAVNGYWRELRLKKQIKRVIFDSVFSEGWMKVGFSAIFGSIDPRGDEAPLEENEYVQDEEIFAIRISPKNIVRDPDAVDGIHDARFVAQRIIKPFDAVRDSKLYKNKNIRPTSVYDPNKEGKSRKDNTYRGGEVEEFFEFWEIWSLDDEAVYWVSEGCDGYLRDCEDWPDKYEGYPFEMLRFGDNGDEPYAPNLITPWEPQLWEKIKIRSMQMDHIKRFNRQLYSKKGNLSKAQMEKFTRGDTGAVIEGESDVPPTPIQYPQLQTDIYGIESRVDLDKDNISGQPNAVRSAPQKTQSRTLGEIDRLIAAFQSRQVDPQDEVETFCEEVAYKIAKAMQGYLPGEKFVRATQEDAKAIQAAFGPDRFDGSGFNFTRKDIKDVEFEVSVKAGSTLPLDRQGKIDAMVNILKLGPSIGIGPGSELPLVIGKNLLAEFEMKEIELAYDKMLADMAIQKQIQKAAMMAEQVMRENKIGQAKKMHQEAMAQPPNGAMPPNEAPL